MTQAMELRPGFSDEELFDYLEYIRWKTSMPWTRWLINHWRKKEGRRAIRSSD